MKKLFLLLLLIPFISPVLAQSEVKKAVKTTGKVLDQSSKAKGGKPLNPGAKGRTNAEIKKATNPGQGGGKSDNLGGALLDDMIDDSHKKGGNKGNKKDGKKD